MLRIGLTGGIGAGKSTVSAALTECGGIVVDGDKIAREVVEPGTEGLAALVEEFGDGILLPDGALNRPALAATAFSDDAKRAALNGIVHPLVAKRRAEIVASVADDDIVVEDIPLLVESGMAPLFPLVVVVHADADVRLKRLVDVRGMSENDARARIAAQAADGKRREVADVVLDNSGTQDALVAQARELWHGRLVPFAENLRARRHVPAVPKVVPADPAWPDQARRVVSRLKTAAGHHALRVDHIGSTAVPGLEAKNVIDVQVTVPSLAAADAIVESLTAAGYPRLGGITGDVAKENARSTVAQFDHAGDDSLWQKRIHASADPGRPTNVHVRVDGWPNQQFALLFVDWLRGNPAEQADYLAVKRAAQDAADYPEAKEPWFRDAYRRAWTWADQANWRPSAP